MIVFSRICIPFVLFLSLPLLSGCGGGSEGTGTRSLEGFVLDLSNEPVSGATVTISETGEAAITDKNGRFEISGSTISGDATIIVETPDLRGEAQVRDISEEESTITVNLVIDPGTSSITSRDVEVVAKIVGSCDAYFENHRTIRQSVRAPQGVECTAKVSIKVKGRTYGGVPVIIEAGGCRENSSFSLVASGETLHGTHSGVAQVAFPFFDDDEHCVYRITAPYRYNAVPEVRYEIHTFTKQAFDRKQGD